MTRGGADDAASSAVVDASVVVEYLVELAHPTQARQVFRNLADVEDYTLWAPDLVHVECASALRKLVALKQITRAQGRERVAQLVRLPLTIAKSQELMPDAFELTEAVTAYDAVYVALAQRLRAPLITADAKLARALRARKRMVVLLQDL